MKNHIDELGKKLHAKLDTGLGQLKSMQAHLDTAAKEAESTIKEKLEASKAVIEEKKQAGEAAKEKLEALIQEKLKESKDSVAEWKEKHDIKKLEKRAQRAEKYADACVDVALYSFLEAEKAILAAVTARLDVENTK